ncbi:hypothetical protein GCM10028832_32940 [Streptomyces sparsus]
MAQPENVIAEITDPVNHSIPLTPMGVNMNTQSLISGYSAYADADEIVPAAEAPAATTTVTTSSQACISAASAISAVSIDNTFDHSC